MGEAKGNKREAALREKFTDRWLRSLKPADKGEFYTVYDTSKTGLAVRVTDQPPKTTDVKAGSITFQFVGRFPGAKSSSRRTVGRFPAVSLAAAHAQVEEWHKAIAAGVDPVKAEAERNAREAAEKRESEQRRFETILTEFIAARKRDGVKKWAEDERDFYRECLPTLYEPNKGKKGIAPVWEGRAVDDITMADILEILDRIKDRGAERQALNVAQKIGTFFNYCVDVELLDVSPYRPKRVAKTIGQKKMRERHLNEDEVRALWAALDDEKVTGAVRDVYRLLLLTGARLNEICLLKWSEVDTARHRIVLEKARTKQGRDHVIPMTDWVAEILENHERQGSVFRSVYDGPFVLETKLRKRVESAMLAEYRKLTNDPEASIEHWTPHDLRRTVQTFMGDDGVSDEVIHIVVGHKSDKLTQTYNKSERMGDKLAALNTWETRLRRIIGIEIETPDNVVPLRA